MITSLKFDKFRGFTDLTVSPVKRINLIAGANNTGKTGILEGLYLVLGDASRIPFLPSVFRSNVSGNPSQPTGDDYPTFWETLFYDKETAAQPSITTTNDAGEASICHLRYSQGNILVDYDRSTGKPGFSIRISSLHEQAEQHSFIINSSGARPSIPNPFAAKFIVLSTRLEHPTQDADLFNQVSLLEGGEEKLVTLLREIDPRLQKLRYLKAPGTYQPLVYVHLGLKNALSMTQTGQGFSKLFSLFCQMLVSKAQILLIDEIENGLYYESLPVIWKGIGALAESENIQVFATTHSRECIVAAHQTFSSSADYNFALHRLQRVNGRIEAVTHDREMLGVAIKSGLEVR